MAEFPWHETEHTAREFDRRSHGCSVTGRTRGYAHRIDVGVGVPVVWAALTTARSLGLWCAPGAEIDPRPGGSLRASVDRVTFFDAHIDVYVPERRMRLIHLPSPALPPGETAIVDDFMLDAAPRGAILRLLGSGFPAAEAWDAVYLQRRTGWERALARLRLLLEREARGQAASGGPAARRSRTAE
jgi:uncharacterized protein YndB with AHSA1/START domain